jgi:hypothetical protein
LGGALVVGKEVIDQLVNRAQMVWCWCWLVVVVVVMVVMLMLWSEFLSKSRKL